MGLKVALVVAFLLLQASKSEALFEDETFESYSDHDVNGYNFPGDPPDDKTTPRTTTAGTEEPSTTTMEPTTPEPMTTSEPTTTPDPTTTTEPTTTSIITSPGPSHGEIFKTDNNPL